MEQAAFISGPMIARLNQAARHACNSAPAVEPSTRAGQPLMAHYRVAQAARSAKGQQRADGRAWSMNPNNAPWYNLRPSFGKQAYPGAALEVHAEGSGPAGFSLKHAMKDSR